jgi:NADP-dependent 3-hydroxy acid dehydrogenase YdfG
MQKNAVVTGGSKGIGLAIIGKLLSGGFKVFTASRSLGGLGPLKEKYPSQLETDLLDLSLRVNVDIFVEKIKSQAQNIDMLVNNAGIFIPGQVHLEAEGDFEKQMNLNVAVAYHITRGLLPLMMPHRSGYIFNICSTASIMPYVDGGSYCISKHALLGFSKVLRKELMPYKIAVSSILPGATFTDSWSGTELPEDRFMKTGNIAEAVWFAWQNRENMVMEEILLRPVAGDI